MTANNQHDTHFIDWRSIRESLAWEEDQQQELLLRIRAAQYAIPTKTTETQTPGSTLSVLTLMLGSERYGIDVMFVRSIRSLPKITSVPSIPHFYRGVVNLRGQIITVLDLQRFFNLPSQSDYQELVMVKSNQLELGLLTTQVQGIEAVSTGSIQPIESIRYARGVTPDQLVILDVATLFEDERLVIGGQEH